MNPKTKLTDDQIRIICARHDIPYRSHARISTGFSHEVHRLNDDLLIKLFNDDEPRKYETERALLRSDLDFLKPELVASYEGTGEQDRSYVIMGFVNGVSLGSKWHEANDEQRERLIQDISKALAAINKLDPKILDPTATDWQTIIMGRIAKLTETLRIKNILTEQHERKIIATTEANKEYLVNTTLHPVYWDIHFDNFLVNEKFELQAIIDLENVELAALDYPLFVIEKLMDEPHKYLREEDEKYARKEDYANLKDWYRKYYPQMFGFDNQEQRVKLYLLIDTLHLLEEWSHVSGLYDKLDELTHN